MVVSNLLKNKKKKIEDGQSNKEIKRGEQIIKKEKRSCSLSSGSSSSRSSSSSSSRSGSSSSSSSYSSSSSSSSSSHSNSSSSSSNSSLSTLAGCAKAKSKQPRSKSGSIIKSRSRSPRKSKHYDSKNIKKAESKTRITRKTRSSSPKRGKKEKTPTPKPCRIYISRLTQNITKEHILEIFSDFGVIKEVDLPLNPFNKLSKGFSYIEYFTPEEAKNAMKHMDGGQIDGQVITCVPVLLPRPAVRRSPIRPGGLSFRGGGRRRSPPRYKRRLPMTIKQRSPHLRRMRSHSRSQKRRKHSRSTSSSYP